MTPILHYSDRQFEWASSLDFILVLGLWNPLSRNRHQPTQTESHSGFPTQMDEKNVYLFSILR
jgi:hypothetical protein